MLTCSTASPQQLTFRVCYYAVKPVATQMSSSKQVSKQVKRLFNMASCKSKRQDEEMRVRVEGMGEGIGVNEGAYEGEGVGMRVGVRVEVREHVRLRVRVRGKVHSRDESDIGGNGE